MTLSRALTGTVTKINRTFVEVTTDAPEAHLKMLYVTPTAKPLAVGDSVKLGYYSSPSRGLWQIMTGTDK